MPSRPAFTLCAVLEGNLTGNLFRFMKYVLCLAAVADVAVKPGCFDSAVLGDLIGAALYVLLLVD